MKKPPTNPVNDYETKAAAHTETDGSIWQRPVKPAHTPTPWEIRHYDGPLIQGNVLSTGEKDLAILNCGKEDAAFIVRACNNFEPLLQAAKDLIQQVGNVGAHQCVGWDCSICRRGDLGWNDLEKAIARAEGK